MKHDLVIIGGTVAKIPPAEPIPRLAGARVMVVVTVPLRPCIAVKTDGRYCGRLSEGTRCPTHTRDREYTRTRAKRAVRPYTNAERVRRAEVVAAHRVTFGNICPGYGVPSHVPSTPLSADHVLEVSAGGSEVGQLQVLCVSCNARKSNACRSQG